MPLPPDLKDFVKRQLDEGAYGSEDEVVVNALYLLRDRTLSRDERLAQLRAAVKLGLDELDRGEGQPWDKEEVWSEVQRRLNERQAKS
jgi:putative addiction module CopG family antidote